MKITDLKKVNNLVAQIDATEAFLRALAAGTRLSVQVETEGRALEVQLTPERQQQLRTEIQTGTEGRLSFLKEELAAFGVGENG